MQRKGRSLIGPFYAVQRAAQNCSCCTGPFLHRAFAPVPAPKTRRPASQNLRRCTQRKSRAAMGLRGFFIIRVGDLT